MKIYTRTGDAGSTSLLGGTKVPKSHLRIEAYGTVDELNAQIGLCSDLLNESTISGELAFIQDRLFAIGSALACDPIKAPKMQIPDIREEDITALEASMDRMDEGLPELKNFILPGGHPTVSTLHIARCVCRRAERCIVRLELESLEVAPIIIQYLNRLSDYLFMLSRHAAKTLGVEERIWKGRS